MSIDLKSLKGGCRRFLSGEKPVSMRERLEGLARLAPDGPPDEYGAGAVLQALEDRVAALLGKEKAVFVYKGMIAQQAALRVWTDRAGRPAVVLHPKSHFDFDEDGALERLHGLRLIRRGVDHAPFAVADLAGVHEPVGAVTVELPLRRAGFKLPSWEELTAIRDWAKAKGAAFHIDGARLWEAQPFYGRPLAEIAGLADSVYVSFYKGLGGLAGCVLAGDAEFVDSTAVWRSRHGGDVYQVYPYALAALDGLDRHLPRMAEYRDRAVAIARALSGIDGVHPTPNPPQTNAFQVYFAKPKDEIVARAADIAREDGAYLFSWAVEASVEGHSMIEIHVGDAAAELAPAEWAELFAKLMR